MTVCQSPDCKLPIVSRAVTVSVAINWGDDDLRDDWAGERTFHSFGCLSDWAAEKAADHDGHVLKEGA